jgi:hypothetical protein
VESARDRIRARYNVIKEQNLDEQPLTSQNEGKDSPPGS